MALLKAMLADILSRGQLLRTGLLRLSAEGRTRVLTPVQTPLGEMLPEAAAEARIFEVLHSLYLVKGVIHARGTVVLSCHHKSMTACET